jgi:hypothetical protein
VIDISTPLNKCTSREFEDIHYGNTTLAVDLFPKDMVIGVCEEKALV